MASLQPYRHDLASFFTLPDNLEQKYTGVVNLVFPLRAQIDKLQHFCDHYLNFRRDESLHVCYRAAAPWVLMQLVYYAEIQSGSAGLSSQYELAFGFPVECFDVTGSDKSRTETGRDWAIVYPYIFADNPISIYGGRMVYGWSKTPIVVDQGLPDLAPADPREIIRVNRVAYLEASSLVASEEEEANAAGGSERSGINPLIFIQTSPDATPVPIRFFKATQERPFFTGRSGLGAAYESIPRAVGSYFNALSAVFGSIGNAISGYEYSDMMSLPGLIARWFGYMGNFAPSMLQPLLGSSGKPFSAGSNGSDVRIVNLKQFRDVTERKQASYQALIESVMKVSNVCDGGVLFDVLSPDVTGGVELKLTRTKDQPIVERLGIEVAYETTLEDELKDEPGKPQLPKGVKNPRVDCLRPVLPFWSKMDVTYGNADRQYWRVPRYTNWSDSDAPNYPSDPTKLEYQYPYRMRGSGAGDELDAPLKYNFQARIFSLKINDTNKLRNTITNYFSTDPKLYTVDLSDPMHPKVWIMVMNYTATRVLNDRSVSVMVPVIMTDVAKGTQELAVAPLYNFFGAEWDYVTENEVYGRFSFQAEVGSSPDAWMPPPPIEPKDPKDPRVPQEYELLSASTYLFPDETVAGKTHHTVAVHNAVNKPIFTFRTLSPFGGNPTSDKPDVVLKAIGLDLFADNKPHYFVSFQQLIDAKQGNHAAYQALLGIPRTLTIDKKPSGPDPVPFDSVEVGVFSVECLQIFENLGIEYTPDAHGVLRTAPETAILVSGTLEDSASKVLCWRAGNGVWKGP